MDTDHKFPLPPIHAAYTHLSMRRARRHCSTWGAGAPHSLLRILKYTSSYGGPAVKRSRQVLPCSSALGSRSSRYSGACARAAPGSPLAACLADAPGRYDRVGFRWQQRATPCSPAVGRQPALRVGALSICVQAPAYLLVRVRGRQTGATRLRQYMSLPAKNKTRGPRAHPQISAGGHSMRLPLQDRVGRVGSVPFSHPCNPSQAGRARRTCR